MIKNNCFQFGDDRHKFSDSGSRFSLAAVTLALFGVSSWNFWCVFELSVGRSDSILVTIWWHIVGVLDRWMMDFIGVAEVCALGVLSSSKFVWHYTSGKHVISTQLALGLFHGKFIRLKILLFWTETIPVPRAFSHPLFFVSRSIQLFPHMQPFSASLPFEKEQLPGDRSKALEFKSCKN